MNPKTILWSLLAVVVLLPSTWFAWSVYQHSENEKILNSIATIMSEPTSDIPDNMESLQIKIKDIEIAISIMQQLPPTAKDFYRQAQSNLSKLQIRKDNLSQLLETELKVLQNIE